MNLGELYALIYWIAALLDVIWMIALLNRFAERKLRDTFFHHLFLLVPMVLAVFFYQRWSPYGFWVSAWMLPSLGVLLWLYFVYLSGRQWMKGLGLLAISALTVLSATGTVLSVFIVADIRPMHCEFPLRMVLEGVKSEELVLFYISRAIVSAILFFLLGMFFSKKTTLFWKKCILGILLLLSMVFSITILMVLSSSDLRNALNPFAGYMNSDARLAAIIPVVLINILVFSLYVYLQKLRHGSYEADLLAEKKRFEENRHSDAEAIWENVRKVRHDIKQHLTILSGYLEDNEIEKCKDYLSDLLGNIDRMGNLLKSENRVLDYLINSKLCGPTDTEVVISGSVGDLSDIADADLASIVGNLLDNAVEAVAEAAEKRIELHFAMQNSNRILVCKNTVKASVLSDNPDLLSTKGGGTHLGLGTHIIRETVTKYHGMIDFFEDHEMFCVQIVLPMAVE